ncbi:hypothetical protein Tco_0622092 [Tanacetum coccineum]
MWDPIVFVAGDAVAAISRSGRVSAYGCLRRSVPRHVTRRAAPTTLLPQRFAWAGMLLIVGPAFAALLFALRLRHVRFTYTPVYTNSEPWRFQWVSDNELEAPEVAPQSLRQAPPYLDYVLGPEHPPSPDYAPNEDQPLLDDASPTTLSPGYVTDSDPEEDPADYPADRGDDDDDESSDDDDYDNEEQEASKDDDEEEEHPAPIDSSVVPVDDPVPSVEDTKAFEIDESAHTPVPLPRRRRARISVRPQTPMLAATEALIVAVAATLPSSPPPSPLTPLSSPLP